MCKPVVCEGSVIPILNLQSGMISVQMEEFNGRNQEILHFVVETYIYV
jgi:hypothetical protein